MFNLTLKKKPVLSNASRFTSFFKFYFPLKITFNPLMYNIKNRAGRSSSTGIVMRSKGSKSYKVRHYNINYFARDTSIGFTANFTLVRFKNKLISLIFFGSGTVSYHQTTSSTRLFSLTRLFTYAEKREIRESKNSTKYDGDEGYR